jgi:penicillin amidase
MTERDMLDLQLDDRALFLERWQKLALSVLADPSKRLDVLAQDLVTSWGERASIESVGYRIVRAFRLRVHGILLDALTAAAARVPGFDLVEMPRQTEGPVWQLLRERPAHLLPPGFTSWDGLLAECMADVLAEATEGEADLKAWTWGERNRAELRHGLSSALGPLSRFMDMPATPMAGDTHMPRVQSPSFGPSERFVVSPGLEARGFLHTPAGQSGHPLSPFYRSTHADWLAGAPTPLLPGEEKHLLTLSPSTD